MATKRVVNKKKIRKATPTKPRVNKLSWQLDQKTKIILALIIGLTFVAFFPSMNNTFTNWDDQYYVTENTWITSFSGENLEHIFTETLMGNYHPITVLSLSFNHLISGTKPALYHLTNVLIHMMNVFWVFFLVYFLTAKRRNVAIVTALLFAIHPMHVESVSWISERKDVLYAFFMLPAMISYIFFRQSGIRKYYWYAIVLFVLSCLSKGMAVSMAPALVLIDLFQSRKIDSKAIMNYVPFFALAMLFGIIAVIAQGEAVDVSEKFSLGERIQYGCYGFLVYLLKFIVPYKLSNYYPYPNPELGIPAIYSIAPFLVLAIVGFSVYMLKRNRVVSFGLLFFLVTIVLVLQFISVGQVIMAERYSYIPYIGLGVIIGYGYDYLVSGKNKMLTPMKNLWIAGLVAVAILFSIITFQRTKVWKNSGTLWTDVIKKYPTLGVAYYDRALYYSDIGETDKAISDYSSAIQYKKEYYRAQFNLAQIYQSQNREEEALVHFLKAEEFILKKEPSDPNPYTNIGNIYNNKGDYKLSISYYQKALALDPNYELAHSNLGIAYFRAGNLKLALESFTKAITLNPNNPSTYYNRSSVYANMGNKKQARVDYQKSLQLGRTPDDQYWQWLQN